MIPTPANWKKPTLREVVDQFDGMIQAEHENLKTLQNKGFYVGYFPNRIGRGRIELFTDSEKREKMREINYTINGFKRLREWWKRRFDQFPELADRDCADAASRFYDQRKQQSDHEPF